MSDSDTLAYFLDEEQLETTLPGWPKGMNLVLCLDARGGWSFLVYHEQEIPTLMERIASVLDRPIGGFAITPEVEGHPTRRVLFSEEQQLLAMLGRTEKLVETAQDYAINYTFALEEGLDPEEVTRRVPVPSGPLGGMQDRLRDASLEDSAPAAGDLAERLPQRAPGYIAPEGVPDLSLHEADLSLHDGWLHLRVGPPNEPADAVAAEEVAFREDFDRILLPREVLGAGWRPGAPIALALEESALPPALVAPLRARGGTARLAVTEGGLYLGPLRPAEAPAPASELSVLARRLTAGVSLPQVGWRARMTALVLLCLASGVTGVMLKDRVAPQETVAAISP